MCFQAVARAPGVSSVLAGRRSRRITLAPPLGLKVMLRRAVCSRGPAGES
ncbi:MAG: hypothetical protein M3Z06_03765 [Actinomycetota bacterium]|nr:hypothetical protein [Actinomycetota bacterium]